MGIFFSKNIQKKSSIEPTEEIVQETVQETIEELDQNNLETINHPKSLLNIVKDDKHNDKENINEHKNKHNKHKNKKKREK